MIEGKVTITLLIRYVTIGEELKTAAKLSTKAHLVGTPQ